MNVLPQKHMPPTLSIKINPSNGFHHVYSNNGVYYIALTLHHHRFKTRIRKSLETHDEAVAIQRRDALLRAAGNGTLNLADLLVKENSVLSVLNKITPPADGNNVSRDGLELDQDLSQATSVEMGDDHVL